MAVTMQQELPKAVRGTTSTVRSPQGLIKAVRGLVGAVSVLQKLPNATIPQSPIDASGGTSAFVRK